MSLLFYKQWARDGGKDETYLRRKIHIHSKVKSAVIEANLG